MGIEPTYLAWEANVLPLNYTRARPELYGLKRVPPKKEDRFPPRPPLPTPPVSLLPYWPRAAAWALRAKTKPPPPFPK